MSKSFLICSAVLSSPFWLLGIMAIFPPTTTLVGAIALGLWLPSVIASMALVSA